MVGKLRENTLIFKFALILIECSATVQFRDEHCSFCYFTYINMSFILYDENYFISEIICTSIFEIILFAEITVWV